MLAGPANESVKFFRLSNNPLIIWSSELFGFSLGSKLLAVFVAGICALLLLVVRQQEDLMKGFAISAILALYWSYSRHYDVLLLTIPLLVLLRLWKTRNAGPAVVAFLALGLLLWCPIRINVSRWPVVELSYAIVNALVIAVMMLTSSRKATVASMLNLNVRNTGSWAEESRPHDMQLEL
jgi:hypothetical protein